MLVVHGARKVDADGEVDGFWLVADDGAIIGTGTGDGWRAHVRDDAHVHNASGRILTPGFIDLHAHGGGGASFDDGPGAIRQALVTHRAHGTTRSVISLVAAPLSELCVSLAAIASLAESDPLILGAHLEGPFLAPARRGAHKPEYLAEPSPAAVAALLDAARGTLRQITLAPELDGAFAAYDTLATAGVVLAVGHTEADETLARAAFENGARLLTHAFNAMPGIHHRAPGPVVAAFGDPRIVLEIILDGEHVHPDVVRLAFAAAPGRIALVTDAMAAAGAAEGDYLLGELAVTVRNGLAVLAGTDTIAGSTLTQDAALRIAVERVGLPLVAAVTALTLTPARVLAREHDLGRLAVGYRADAVLLHPDLTVDRVWAEGEPALG
ncbi:N-acetylglucosamine-6-phosphate deacetylase [Microbacteriaceae bacterium VKM Ac-2854]|nr:N-acetylglucosamine-6-phosphate deacetylase [Microbacteriaceae bacterium VKM Ac-2854]